MTEKKERVILPDNLQRIFHCLSNNRKRPKGKDFGDNLSFCVVTMALELQKLHLEQIGKLCYERLY